MGENTSFQLFSISTKQFHRVVQSSGTKTIYPHGLLYCKPLSCPNLIHASIGKEQSRVIQRDGSRRMHVGMPVFHKEVNEPLSNVTAC